MATILGEAILIIVGNPDFLKVVSIFGLSVSLLMAAVYMWKHFEEWKWS